MTMLATLAPSCLLPEVYAPWKDRPGFLATQVERVASEGFYRSVELSPVALPADRARIRQACAAAGVEVSVWLTSILERDGLDFGSLDASVRRASVEAVGRLMAEAAECGATTVALVSGADPGDARQAEAYEGAFEALGAIATDAAGLGLAVMLEPLDRFAHKKRLIGPTSEAVALIDRLRQDHPDFGLAYDAAHAALNGEDCLAALDASAGSLVNVHLSNAVLDPADPLYGDHHMMPGAPGFLTVEAAARIAAGAARIGATQGRRIRIAVEARAPMAADDQHVARVAQAFLDSALRMAETGADVQA